jgi:hypothetical protein
MGALAGRWRLGARMNRYPLRWRALGMWAGRRFTRSGWVACAGLPLPRVRNLGGTIEVGKCLFYPGVRLEIGESARLTIGSGTFLNRNVEVVGWKEVSNGRDCQIGWDGVILDTDQHPVAGRGWDIRPVRIGDGSVPVRSSLRASPLATMPWWAPDRS